MSKRIKQNINNKIAKTFTTGHPEGNLPNFDVSLTTPAGRQHRPTKLRLNFVQSGKNRSITFDGRQARTLHEVLNRHFKN